MVSKGFQHIPQLNCSTNSRLAQKICGDWGPFILTGTAALRPHGPLFVVMKHVPLDVDVAPIVIPKTVVIELGHIEEQDVWPPDANVPERRRLLCCS